MKNEIILGFISSIPVWGLLLFFLYRTVRNRDSFERKTIEELEEIKKTLMALDKSMALMAKDIETASNLTGTVSDLSERIGKLKYDIDNYFSKLRDLDKRVSNGA